MTAASLSVQLLLTVGLGIFIGRRGIVKGDFARQLTSLLMDICIPCLVLKSMLDSFRWSELKNYGLLFVLAIALWLSTLGLGHLIYRLTGKSSTGRIIRYTVMFPAYVFVGFPVIEALYGEQGLFYLVIFTVPYRIIYFTTAERFLLPPGQKQEKPTMRARVRGWLSPAVVAIFVALLLCFIEVKLPMPVAGVVNSLASCTSPLGMLLCGLSLSRYPFRKMLKLRYLLYPLMRNLVMPALFLGIARLLALKPDMAQIIVAFAALPVVATMAVFTIRSDPDPETQFEAAACVFLTTLAAVVTIPLWDHLLNAIFP